MMKRYTIVNYIHDYLKNKINNGDLLIDATCGKGNDTAFLCELAGKEGNVLAFDIQESAVNKTKELLKEKGYSNAKVILDSHENMKKYAEDETVSAILFNLGYLPGGNHLIATKGDTTIKAIEKGLDLLKVSGIMSICIYSGGDTGFSEKEEVLKYLKCLDNKKYLVITNEFYNKPNNPPLPVFIIKIKS